MAKHQDRVDALVAEAKALIAEISADGRRAVEEAESVAEENVSLHAALREELASLRARAERCCIRTSENSPSMRSPKSRILFAHEKANPP